MKTNTDEPTIEEVEAAIESYVEHGVKSIPDERVSDITEDFIDYPTGVSMIYALEYIRRKRKEGE